MLLLACLLLQERQWAEARLTSQARKEKMDPNSRVKASTHQTCRHRHNCKHIYSNETRGPFDFMCHPRGQLVWLPHGFEKRERFKSTARQINCQAGRPRLEVLLNANKPWFAHLTYQAASIAGSCCGLTSLEGST